MTKIFPKCSHCWNLVHVKKTLLSLKTAKNLKANQANMSKSNIKLCFLCSLLRSSSISLFIQFKGNFLSFVLKKSIYLKFKRFKPNESEQANKTAKNCHKKLNLFIPPNCCYKNLTLKFLNAFKVWNYILHAINIAFFQFTWNRQCPSESSKIETSVLLCFS